jgi:uncharacterized membrane protein
MQMSDLPEEQNMFKERLEVEETEDQTKDPFIPARECKFDPANAVVHIEL